MECLNVGEIVHSLELETTVGNEGRADVHFSFSIPTVARKVAGYALRATATTSSGVTRATTAIDVAPHWSRSPRYGFLSEFAPDEPQEEARRRLDDALRLHLNVLQFYDWMPNHHDLVAETDTYSDTQGRTLSRRTVERRIALCHERGIAALAYGALYGAEKSFADRHSDWLLYDGERRPLHLAGLYYLQDFSRGSGWREWILRQYARALEVLGFDGIHIDQYGSPKQALSRAGGGWHAVEPDVEFPGFVEEAAARARAIRPDIRCIFNCVNAWPLERMAEARSDAATYIEVWEPHVTYRDLYELVRRARILRPDKQVILAAYLRPFHPSEERTGGALEAFRLAFAAIHASGGSQLIAGEGRSLLSEAYYPSHGTLSEDEFAVVRRYFDFVVRNRELLDLAGPDHAWTHVGPTNEVVTLEEPSGVPYGAGPAAGRIWTILHRREGRSVLHLVNLVGLEHDHWSAPQRTPKGLGSIELRVRAPQGVSEIFWDSPDDSSGVGRRLAGRRTPSSDVVHVSLPELRSWALVTWRGQEATS